MILQIVSCSSWVGGQRVEDALTGFDCQRSLTTGIVFFARKRGYLTAIFSCTDSCIYMQNNSERHNDEGRAKTSLEKYVPLTLLEGFEKGYSRFYCVRELDTEHNCSILTPTLMAVSLVSFSFSRVAQLAATQSLEWHVWSSPSGNNCHAVQMSLSSGASVYECIMGFFPCPILLARSTYAIFLHKCHWNVSLPSGASLWNGKFGRVEG